MRTALTAVCALALAATASAEGKSSTKFMDMAKAGKPLYAKIETSMGTIVASLDTKDAPYATENFVGLATGEKEWTTPAGEKTHKPLYDGVIFHRVIPGFMVQGGDPEGSGRGGPGFKIKDDYPNQHGLHFTKGKLGMARPPMPDSGGSQFFIMVNDYPSLDGQYTIFGEVLSGQDVADAISKVERDRSDKPVKPVIMKKVTISAEKPKA